MTSTHKQKSIDPRPLWPWLLAIFVLALIVRIVVVTQLKSNNPGFWSPDVDSSWHYEWGKELARGHWIGKGVFYRAPLYPYLLGIWFTLFGDNLLLLRLLQGVIGAFSAVMLALLGLRVFDRKIGLTAGFAWSLYGPMIYYESELLIPVIFIPLALLALWMALGRMESRRSSFGAWIPVGLILGLAAIARPNILITVPIFIIAAWISQRPLQKESVVPFSRRLPAIAALLIGLILPILPVTVRNAVVGGDPVLIAYQGGVNLYIGNNPKADGLTMQMPELAMDAQMGWDEFVGKTDSLAEVLAGSDLSPSEISSFWLHRALGYIANHPARSLGEWLRKLYYVFNGFEVGDQTDIYNFTKYSSLLHMLIWHWGIFMPFGICAPLGLIGLVLVWKRNLAARLLVGFIVLYLPSVVLFLATARHRLPIVPLLVLFAAAACWRVFTCWRSKRYRTALGTIVAAIILAIVFNLPTVAKIMRDPAYSLFQEALAYDRQGDYAQAIDLYGEALNQQPMLLAARRNLALALVHNQQFDLAITVAYSYLQFREDDAEALNNLGLAYLGKGDTSKAMGSFRVAAQKNPKLAQPYINLGDVEASRGRANVAAGYYGEAIKADSSYGPAYNTLGVLLARGGLVDSALTVLRTCTIRNPDYSSAWANYGNVLLQTGHTDDAVSAIRGAVRLTPQAPSIRYALALALTQAGQIDEAKQELHKVLQLDPHNPEATRKLQELNSLNSPN